jgi:endonuclease YncB( thermonuclease family)
MLVLPWSFGPAVAQAEDCTAFDSQVWAQSIFVLDPLGNAALDPDGNGRACEEFPVGAAPAWWTTEIPASAEPVTLASVVDGDTIRVIRQGVEEPVRLILIDTPETHDPNDPPECYGAEASSFLDWLLSLGGQIYLEPDVTDRDRYDRLLRYAWLDFGEGEVYLVNEAMVRSGYAALYTYPPDVKYVEQIRAANTFAREHGYGLWSGCITDAEGDTQELTGGQAPSRTRNRRRQRRNRSRRSLPIRSGRLAVIRAIPMPASRRRRQISTVARFRTGGLPSWRPIRTPSMATSMGSAANVADHDRGG